jgi:hypothetical protein
MHMAVGVGLLTRLRDGRSSKLCSVPDRGKRRSTFFSNSSRPALGLPHILFNGYQGLFPRGYNSRVVTTRLYLENGKVPPLTHVLLWNTFTHTVPLWNTSAQTHAFMACTAKMLLLPFTFIITTPFKVASTS